MRVPCVVRAANDVQKNAYSFFNAPHGSPAGKTDPLKVFELRAPSVRGHVHVNLTNFVRHATSREKAESLIFPMLSNLGHGSLFGLLNSYVLA